MVISDDFELEYVIRHLCGERSTERMKLMENDVTHLLSLAQLGKGAKSVCFGESVFQP
eukprot:COSAG02_NODE_687_length_18478_cov_23.093476_12_plen_58_part_00